MDVYGNALMDSKREASSRVVSLLLRSLKGTGIVEATKKAPSGQRLQKASSQPLTRRLLLWGCVGLRIRKWLRGVDLQVFRRGIADACAVVEEIPRGPPVRRP
jgi:hypothetical protein